MMDLEERNDRKDFIESLTALERGIYADMIMRSLRGSWRSPRKRTFILQWIGKTGEMEFYDAGWLVDKTESYFKSIGKGRPDGRTWRRYYQEKEVDVTQLPESRIRELASHIPDDMTWDDYRINKEFNDD